MDLNLIDFCVPLRSIEALISALSQCGFVVSGNNYSWIGASESETVLSHISIGVDGDGDQFMTFYAISS